MSRREGASERAVEHERGWPRASRAMMPVEQFLADIPRSDDGVMLAAGWGPGGPVNPMPVPQWGVEPGGVWSNGNIDDAVAVVDRLCPQDQFSGPDFVVLSSFDELADPKPPFWPFWLLAGLATVAVVAVAAISSGAFQ